MGAPWGRAVGFLASIAMAAVWTGVPVQAAPATSGDARHDAVTLSIGVSEPSAPFVVGDRIGYLSEGELLVWIDPSAPGDFDTLEVDNAVIEPVITADTIFIPALFSVIEIALDDGAEVAVYEDRDWEGSVASLDVSDEAVAVGTLYGLTVFDRGGGAPRWSIPTGGAEATQVAITPDAVVVEVDLRAERELGIVGTETGEVYTTTRGLNLHDVIALDDTTVAIAATSSELDEHYLDLIEPAASESRWTLSFASRLDTVALAGSTLVVTDETPGVHFVDPADGSIIGAADLGARARNRAVAHPTLGAVIVDDTGTVYGFDPATGEPTIAPFAIGEAPASAEPAGLGAASEVHGFVLDGDMLYITLTGEQSRLIAVDLARLG